MSFSRVLTGVMGSGYYDHPGGGSNFVCLPDNPIYDKYIQGDHFFSSIVLPSITYGLPVYGASEAELTAMQCFLDRCYNVNIDLNLFLSSTF